MIWRWREDFPSSHLTSHLITQETYKPPSSDDASSFIRGFSCRDLSSLSTCTTSERIGIVKRWQLYNVTNVISHSEIVCWLASRKSYNHCYAEFPCFLGLILTKGNSNQKILPHQNTGKVWTSHTSTLIKNGPTLHFEWAFRHSKCCQNLFPR